MRTQELLLFFSLLLSGMPVSPQPGVVVKDPLQQQIPLDQTQSVSGATITVPILGHERMAFVYIAPGNFLMGSPDAELGRSPNEGPQHEVKISRGFYLGKYEVTWGQWQTIMNDMHSKQTGVLKPVEGVSWNDVMVFIHRLNVAAGDSLYRLPTEAEWEYACRAGTTTAWSFGNDERRLVEYAWYKLSQSYADLHQKMQQVPVLVDGSLEALNNETAVGDAHPVGQRRPNPWGLYDMYGNVWEWCQDWYSSTYYGISPAVDPQGPSTGVTRVVRGGFYNSYGRSVRSANRYSFSPTERIPGTGFRLMRLVK